MNTLLQNKDKIFSIKKKIENKDPSYYSHFIIQNHNLAENAVSIVMTSSNRSKQTYFTLSSMLTSSCKNIQVIIVDDSTNDPIDCNKLMEYPFYIDFIKINRENKDWHNPLVNYNIGFQYIKGSKVVIQNAEVCHIGNILGFVYDTIIDNNYYTFDVKSALNFDANEIIYNNDISTIDIYNNEKLNNLWYNLWYQGESHNRNFHFLTAMTKTTFDKVKEFSYDCTMGGSYDDDDFLLKIISKNIYIVNIFHNHYGIGGIHLFHGIALEVWDKNVESNEYLFYNKKNIYCTTGNYIDVTENYDDFYDKYKLLLV